MYSKSIFPFAELGIINFDKQSSFDKAEKQSFDKCK